MKTLLDKLRRTQPVKALGVIRILLGFLFLTTGIMKLAVPKLADAFAGQLTQASIPLHSLNVWIVPITEVAVGVLLLLGIFSRLASAVVIPMMLVATYVHLVVDDPDLFPLQPEAPIIPLAAIAFSAYVLWRGGGAWSMDLQSSSA